MIYPLILVMIFAVFLVKYSESSASETEKPEQYSQITNQSTESIAVTEQDIEPAIAESFVKYPKRTVSTVYPQIRSEYGVLVDADNDEIIADKNSDQIIYPASMTKIMTLIVAVENIKDLDDTFTMTYDILAPLVAQNASRAGFMEDEKVMIKDLLYGSVLPSGADATVALAEYISGSEDEFVKLMNEKTESLGLKNTHFMNTSGLHHKNHYTTVTDMAVILEYAIKNPLCREILSTYQYTTSPTDLHPDGILLTSTMFSRMYGDEAEGVQIVGGKTGYTDEAGQCLASFAVKDGKTYIAVTTKGTGSYSMIYDAIDLYAEYLPETESKSIQSTETTE